MLPPTESLWYQMRSHPRHGEPSYRGHLGGETACYAWRTYIRASASSTSLMRGRRCSGRGRTLSWRSLARALIYKVCVHGPAAYDSAYSVVMCPGQNCCWRTHERTCSVSRAHRRTSGSSRSRRYRRGPPPRGGGGGALSPPGGEGLRQGGPLGGPRGARGG